MAPEASFLPYGRHSVDEDDVAAVAEVLRGDWLTMGPAVPAFESALASAVGAAHAVSCSSGTAALHLAALAAGLKEGDAAIVPAMTFLATANCVRYVGAEVVFADVDAQTGLMGPEHLDQALRRAKGQRAKAVFPVDLNGQCGDLTGIHRLAKQHGLVVIEDACHALGTTYRDGETQVRIGDGTFADMTVFSFHPVKTIAAGEGGAVTTNDAKIEVQLAALRSHGMIRDPASFTQRDAAFDRAGAVNPWYYEMPDLGMNYRLSDIHAALGSSQLKKLDKFAARRRALAQLYDRSLAPMSPLVRPIGRTAGCDPVWHLYAVLIDFERAGLSRGQLMERLRGEEIGTQVHYIPVHIQPYYRERYGALDLPGAADYYDRILSLPLYPAMTDADVGRVAGALARCCN